MKKLKIGLLSYRSDPFSGGQGIYIKNVSEALQNRGHEVTIFSGNPLPIVSNKIKVVEINTPGYFETFNSFERFKIFQAQEKTRLDLWDFIETFTGTFTEPIFFGDRLLQNTEFAKTADSYDVFHDNQSISNYPDSINKKLITTLHHPIHVDRDIDLENESSFLRKLAIKRWYSFLNFQKKNLKKVKKIISPSKSSKKDICHYFQYPAEQISVIWNGIDLADCKFHQRTSFNSEFVTIISSDVPMKNLRNILKALYLLKNDGLSAKLTIIGDLREDNKKLINDLDLNDLVSFRKKLPRNELIKILNASDIGIAASSYEGFGFPLVEMIATGLPVIVSDKASLPELAGDAGLKFNSDDVSDLKDKMKELVKNHALRDKLANNSKVRRDAFFGWDEYAKKLEDLFEEIISGNI
ncbi:MAG: glycosyltransferase family 4 protein [Gammaproteobacteria bacterium]|uniref:Glycosyltransferase family 1 protein n=1 Tax=SAR86 cluster bacterium TaxID=2030880 RepID=A0A520MS55_9GAMM|nr:MAG: glycosyltransferase family 1 protein [SAR86 cluster bacterium]|tara:strand:+ start:1947 stop:3179 length:1233 start_codon:yes stop_codon:yes gene_type:complete